MQTQLNVKLNNMPKSVWSLCEANSQTTMSIVFKLRYLEYVQRGFIEKNEQGEFQDHYDKHIANSSFLLAKDGEPVGTLRLSVSDWKNQGIAHRSVEHFPSYLAYQSILQSLLNEGHSIIEISRLSIPKGSASSILKLFGAATQLSDRLGIEYLFAAVRPEHIDFYKNLLFEKVAAERNHPLVQFNTVGMLCHYRHAKEIVQTHSLFKSMWSGPQVDPVR